MDLRLSVQDGSGLKGLKRGIEGLGYGSRLGVEVMLISEVYSSQLEALPGSFFGGCKLGGDETVGFLGGRAPGGNFAVNLYRHADGCCVSPVPAAPYYYSCLADAFGCTSAYLLLASLS